MQDLYAEFKAVVRAFNASGIPYALCGGLAYAIHVRPRVTLGMDFLYYLCALRCRAETPLVAGVDLPTSGEVWVDDSESWNGRTVEPPNGRTLSGGSA